MEHAYSCKELHAEETEQCFHIQALHPPCRCPHDPLQRGEIPVARGQPEEAQREGPGHPQHRLLGHDGEAPRDWTQDCNLHPLLQVNEPNQHCELI